MSDETTRRFERIEDRQTTMELREAGRDVKVELAISTMNRLSVLVGTAGIAVLGTVVTFVLTSTHT